MKTNLKAIVRPVILTTPGAIEPLPTLPPDTARISFLSNGQPAQDVTYDDDSFVVPVTAEQGTLVAIDVRTVSTPIADLKVTSQYATIADFRSRHPDSELSDEAIASLLRRSSAAIDAFCNGLRAVWRTEVHAYADTHRVYLRRNPIQEVATFTILYDHGPHHATVPYPYREDLTANVLIVRDLHYIECTYMTKWRFYLSAFAPYQGFAIGDSRCEVMYLGGFLPRDMPPEIVDVAIDLAGSMANADAQPPELVGVTSIHQGSQSYSIDPNARSVSGPGAVFMSPQHSAILGPYRNGQGAGTRLA